jgi:hypothetical protein
MDNSSPNNFSNPQTAYDTHMPVTYVNNAISDQQPISQFNVSLPNNNQTYQQPNVVSPNHNTVNITPGHNHHHNYKQPVSSTDNVTISTDNNHHDSNNIHHHNNQQPTSSPLQFFSPQSNIFPPSVNITINSPQTNFIIMPNADIQQILACLNHPSSANDSKARFRQ